MKRFALVLTVAALCTACGPSAKERRNEETRRHFEQLHAGMVMDVDNATEELEIARLNADTARIKGTHVDTKAVEAARKTLAAAKLKLQLDSYLAEVR